MKTFMLRCHAHALYLMALVISFSPSLVSADIGPCDTDLVEALNNPFYHEMQELLDDVRTLCDYVIPGDEYEALPDTSCCGFPQPNHMCQRDTTCAAYHPSLHKICICEDNYGPPPCGSNMKKVLAEEMIHAFQKCAGDCVKRPDCPYTRDDFKPIEEVYEPQHLIITEEPNLSTSPCRHLTPEKTLCQEMHAKCQNPYEISPPPKDGTELQRTVWCNNFCGNYGGSTCCKKNCMANMTACCEWIEWPFIDNN